MKITTEEINRLLSALGFEDNTKLYQNDTIIKIDFENEKIIYPDSIKKGDETTSNFRSSENFVVLECVDRLLTIGYEASSLTLEQKWPVGRQNKGKLDILVRDKDTQSYLMIECKTWGDEFVKEHKKMLRDGGQLFSYYKQDTNAEYLCLYTSKLDDNKVIYENQIVTIENDFKLLGEVKEIYQRWNKQFSHNGIFDSSPYQVKIKSLLNKDLKELRKEDSSIIYHQFLEILRHNVVSDKPNAFNKIFNLFLCKVVDEDRGDDEELQFQWIENKDNFETLFDRLNSLYKDGMKRFLGKEVTDYSEEDISNIKDGSISRILKELRYYKNQEFAFVEVYNKESFEENASIVREVIELLQRWKIRYNHKQQFLGDFFELLLNTGFKQEAGQFFTPVPLVRFIIRGMPLEKIVKEKIEKKEADFLPYVIDFACGSGHFLTEMMDILQADYIQNIDEKKLTQTQRSKLNHYRAGDFEWAKEFILGYRERL